MFYLAMNDSLPRPTLNLGRGFTRLLAGLGGLVAGLATPTDT